jgi:Reverse transcriptase (RNA-dependent DNA polymerase)
MKYFPKIDLTSMYNQLRVEPQSVEYTVFATPYGNFQYKVMPFGLCNGPAIFQWFISYILFKNLNQNCAVYLDDILITTLDIPNHT